jgi:DNA-binding transcriptional LysR family regulator
LIPALIAGLGIAVLPRFIAQDALDSGALESILEDWSAPTGALYLITPSLGPRPARITALLDFFAERLTA